MSIIFNKDRCNLRERKIVGNKFELVLAVGRIGNVPRKVAIFCAYLEPRMRVAELESLNRLVCDQILQLKAADDPLIFFGGDLNRKSMEEAFENFPDIKQDNFSPTRGDACLDVLFSNSSEVSTSVWPPLQSREGAPSDHMCMIGRVIVPVQKNFEWVRKTVRKQSDKSCRNFAEEVRGLDWDAMLPDSLQPDDMIEVFENKIAALVETHFPVTTYRCRSNEPPWITHGIRRISKKKKRVYKREGKSRLWCTLTGKAEEMIEKSKTEFVDRSAEAGPKAYFTAIKALAASGTPTPWDVCNLFPEMSEEQAGEEISSYFTQITDQFTPLEEPRAVPTELRPEMSEEEVLAWLRRAKKPSSQVEGDVPPRVMKKHFEAFVKPVTKIFNSVLRHAAWPRKWKTETTVVIPKVPNPASLSECRNISCTAFLSKVLESVILKGLREEIEEDPCQYGGIKKCSVNHLLTDLFEAVLAPLDEGNPSVIVGIDFEKAFNRLDHQNCLKELRRLGASEASLNLVRSFLTGRVLRVRVGGTLSPPKQLSGGSPQGSILGCYLYCVATQQLNADLAATIPPRPPGVGQIEEGEQRDQQEVDPVQQSDDEDQLWLADHREWEVEDWNTGVDDREDLVLNADGDGTVGNPVLVVKYIDDTTTIETVAADKVVRHIQMSGPSEHVPADETERLMEGVIARSDEIGMRVNCKKTQVLCVSGANGYNTSASVSIGSEVINSVESIKLLGFTICAAPGMHGQLAQILDCFRRRFWSLIRLRRAGLRGKPLFKIYSIFVRPVIENNSVIYHSMLGKGQSQKIERLQALVVQLCFGNNKNYEEMRSEQGIPDLRTRRTAAVKKFVTKALANPRFERKWFPRRENIENNLRTRRPVIETRAKTERYYRSPLLHFRRVANDILTAS